MPLDVSRVRALCFDVDGTLCDTDDIFVERLARLLGVLGPLLPPLKRGRLARTLVMSMETPGNFLFSLPNRLGGGGLLAGVSDWFYQRGLRRSRRDRFRIISGVEVALARLGARYPMAVVSARGRRTTLEFLDRFALTDRFRCIATALTCRHTKPFPDPVLWAAEQMSVLPEDCLMIGDTSVDIRAGRAARAQTVGVLCGFGEEDELRRAGADLILPTTADLAAILLGAN